MGAAKVYLSAEYSSARSFDSFLGAGNNLMGGGLGVSGRVYITRRAERALKPSRDDFPVYNIDSG
jgi:hypothetical protein